MNSYYITGPASLVCLFLDNVRVFRLIEHEKIVDARVYIF